MEHLQRFEELSPESQGQNLALTVLYVPHSLKSGNAQKVLGPTESAGVGRYADSGLRRNNSSEIRSICRSTRCSHTEQFLIRTTQKNRLRVTPQEQGYSQVDTRPNPSTFEGLGRRGEKKGERERARERERERARGRHTRGLPGRLAK